MHFEVEQKFRSSDFSALEAKLQHLGVELLPAITQVDSYFAHPQRDFAQTDEALRLRRVGELNFVTYKGPKIDTTTKTRRELELPLLAGETMAQQFRELLLSLGFRAVADVKKQRRCGHFLWDGQEVEIALDEVEAVGRFVELELSADEAGLESATQCLATLASELELTITERRSYLELLLESFSDAVVHK